MPADGRWDLIWRLKGLQIRRHTYDMAHKKYFVYIYTTNYDMASLCSLFE